MDARPSTPERSVILLAAGHGERMRPLTESTPKSMLRVGDVPLLERIIEQVLRLTEGEIVVVTGYRAEQILELVARRFPGQVTCAHNKRFREDVNILSVALGVNQLTRPDFGYTIIETDLLVESAGWEKIFAGHRGRGSFWVTRGVYGHKLTGGIVHADRNGTIDAIEYRPQYDPAFDGWAKMVGVLSVAPETVARDRALREAAMAASLRQYYLQPWVGQAALLPCFALDLGDLVAESFNTPQAFSAACRAFLLTPSDENLNP